MSEATHRRRIGIVLCLALVGALLGTATFETTAQADDESCQVEAPVLDKHAYLRALSLDIRGVVPTIEEHRSIEELDTVPDALIDEWLQSEEFADRVWRQQRALIWANISNQRLQPRSRTLDGGDGTTTPLWIRYFTPTTYRGAAQSCLNEPARFGPDGEILTTQDGVNPAGDPILKEGYVMVRPYWAPDTEVRVCAFDAQEHSVSAEGQDCSTNAGNNKAGCGCGPNLRWCQTSALNNQVLDGFQEDLRRRVRAMVLEREPYTSLFTSRRAFVNGPLVSYWRDRNHFSEQITTEPAPLDRDTLPDLAPGDVDTWVEVELPEYHAGILTHPVFLLRFQTNRARANRFYDAFLCQSFQPPAGGLPAEDEVAARQVDLQQRQSCNYCHALLEPAAAYWGRWAERGAGFLAPDAFPDFRQDCDDCARGFEACSAECTQRYVVRATAPEEEAYLGMLQSFAFLRPEHESNVEGGPQAMVNASIVSDQFQLCTTRNVATWLLPDVGEEQEPWIRETSRDFLVGGFNYVDLVRTVLTSDAYRRVR